MTPTNFDTANRRAFLARLGLVSAATSLTISGCATTTHAKRAPAVAAAAPAAAQGGDEGVSPAEDLMREHGVLNRVLLVYEECLRRIDEKRDLPPEPLAETARLVR